MDNKERCSEVRRQSLSRHLHSIYTVSGKKIDPPFRPVSYTHLTLPTILRV